MDLFWLGEQRKNIAKLAGEIESLGDKKEQHIKEKALSENRIQELVWNILPEINEKMCIKDNFNCISVIFLDFS